ncbi:hypothetical protein QB910_000099 [Dabrowskivirus KKP3916]|uniref:Transmembrane protein n=1 Tax=Alicyclobacillus phage KKP_3916 TaxID=3040651 RepID=A0AAT9V7P0_9CAUD|nr:hypothetical protein QB910_000099 [Alicyclobacillus phage KKP 3916]
MAGTIGVILAVIVLVLALCVNATDIWKSTEMCIPFTRHGFYKVGIGIKVIAIVLTFVLVALICTDVVYIWVPSIILTILIISMFQG